MSIDAVYVLPCSDVKPLRRTGGPLANTSCRWNGSAMLVPSGHNYPPPLYDDPDIRTLIAEHAAMVAPYAQALAQRRRPR